MSRDAERGDVAGDGPPWTPPDPDWSREAARVMNSPYWSPPADLDGPPLIAACERLSGEQDALLDALAGTVSGPDELPPAARAIYDRAKDATDALADACAERDRMSDNEFSDGWDDDDADPDPPTPAGG